MNESASAFVLTSPWHAVFVSLPAEVVECYNAPAKCFDPPRDNLTTCQLKGGGGGLWIIKTAV